MGNGSVIKTRSAAAVIIFSIITFGIYHVYWAYQIGKELKGYNESGMGPIFNLISIIIFPIVTFFTMPHDVSTAYGKENTDGRISALTGFWNFLPIIGWMIWIVKMQDRMNALAAR